jgi:hypothetical protein
MAESETTTPGGSAQPSLADMQHWTWVLGRAQQMLLEPGDPRPDRSRDDRTNAGFLDAEPDLVAADARSDDPAGAPCRGTRSRA